jgi:hypothetical protein
VIADRMYQPEHLDKHVPGAGKRSGGRRGKWKKRNEADLSAGDLAALELMRSHPARPVHPDLHR